MTTAFFTARVLVAALVFPADVVLFVLFTGDAGVALDVLGGLDKQVPPSLHVTWQHKQHSQSDMGLATGQAV